MPSTEQNIISRIETRGKGACFTPKAFLDLGSPEAIRITLHRLVKRGFIRRLARGLYDFPKQHPTIGLLSPHPDEVAKALSERDASRLQPSGAYAANVLGLSEQAPARIVFLTDGAARHVKVGRQEIILKNTTPRNMATAGTTSGLVIQALRWLGRRNVDDQTCALLAKRLTDNDKCKLIEDARYAPAWVAEIMRRICGAT